jgi:MFS family permease
MSEHAVTPPAIARAAATFAEIDPDRVEPLRRRMLWTLFAISALGSTGYIAAGTVGTLVAAEIAGGAAFGGLPTAVAVLGTAVSAAVLSSIMLRVGRRPGLLAGLGAGATGAVIALVAVAISSIPLLLLGTFLAGFANGGAQLGRYVAADLARPERRASAIGFVVWGSTIGAVTGPNLIAPAGAVAGAAGLPPLAGAYVVTALFIGLAAGLAALFLRPEPYALADPSALEARPTGTEAPAMEALLRRPAVLVGLVALVAGQVVMVLIMTMTPLHLRDHGHDLSTIGIVLSAHLFGMFALSPISGRLTDRFGSRRIIGAGLATLAAAALLSAVAPPDGGTLLTIALFLLGYGWNLGFVAASAMLTSGLHLAERTRVQGVADGLVWTSAAVASLSSGILVAGASYATLGLVAIALLLVPAALLVARRAGAAQRLPI